MRIDWTNKKIYSEGYSVPKKIELKDLAGGIGILTIEVELMKGHLIQYLNNNGCFKKSKVFGSTTTKIETREDALKSTLGPVIEFLIKHNVPYEKDLKSLPFILATRNKYQHEFVHNYQESENMDLHVKARELINIINTIRKLNNRYKDVNEKYVKDQNKKKTSRPQEKKLSKKELIATINQIIRTYADKEGDCLLSTIGCKLNERGISSKDYSGMKLREWLEQFGYDLKYLDDSNKKIWYASELKSS